MKKQRKVILSDQAELVHAAQPEGLANQPEYAALLAQVQKLSLSLAIEEAAGSRIYELRTKVRQLVPPPGRVRMWMEATPKAVILFCVEVSRTARGPFENPIDWFRQTKR